jgi:hypothetical protein
VVFTCALSQVRGPKAARKYIEALGGTKPVVYILTGGIYNMQELYGGDDQVMKDWDKEFWQTYG